jgi:hypothetical protein
MPFFQKTLGGQEGIGERKMLPIDLIHNFILWKSKEMKEDDCKLN